MFVLRIELITNCNWYKFNLFLSIHKNMKKKSLPLHVFNQEGLQYYMLFQDQHL